jgi:hypothetical protein
VEATRSDPSRVDLGPKSDYERSFEEVRTRFSDPQARYGTVVVSTGAHWTTTELQNDEQTINRYFRIGTEHWLRWMVETKLPHQKAFVRAASTGHDCARLGVLQDLEPPPTMYNWHWIP